MLPSPFPSCSQIRIRTATPDDIPSIRSIAYADWNAVYGNYISKAAIDYFFRYAYSTEHLTETLMDPRTLFLVAECLSSSPSIIGFTHARLYPPTRAELVRLYLDLSFTRRGIGKLLLDHIIKQLKSKGITTLFVFVHAENSEALRFYQREGFTFKENTSTTLLGEFIPLISLEKTI